MRATVRWLTCLAPVSLLLLLAIHYYQVPTIISHNLPDSSSGLLGSIGLSRPKPAGIPQQPSSGHALTSIPDLWRQWSSIIYDARPQTSAISLGGSAQTQRPESNNGARKPYDDMVHLALADLESLRASHRLFVEKLGNVTRERDAFDGAGVVMVGGGEYFGPAIISIQMLRRTGSTLPVEVFVPDQKEYEVEICEQYLPRLNARCVVLADIISHADGPSAGLDISHYQLKSLALLLSSFAEVLLLDSDSMPMVQPEKELFKVEPYKSSGLVIWPDFWTSTESPRFWQIAGLPEFPDNLPVTSSEAGQLLVNKQTHIESLLLATYYNIFGPNYYYPLLSQGALGQGDKETFMAAAAVLNSTYYRVKTPVSILGRHDGREQRGTAMVQHLPSDDLAKSRSKNQADTQVKPAFVHANTPKMNAGHLVDEGDLHSYDGKTRLRLLGSEADQIELFGYDLEKTIWELLVQTGCELSNVIREWKGRDRLCERLEEHYTAVFRGESTRYPVRRSKTW